MKNRVPRQIIEPGVLLTAKVALELVTLRVASLVIAQVAFLGERLAAHATHQLIRLNVHVASQLVLAAELLLAVGALFFDKVLVLGDFFQKIRIRHDLVEVRVFELCVGEWSGH